MLFFRVRLTEPNNMLRQATICILAALPLVACEPDPLPDGGQPPPDYANDDEEGAPPGTSGAP